MSSRITGSWISHEVRLRDRLPAPLARGVVVVDREDVVRYVEYVPEVTHEPDYEKALAVARELAK